MKKTFPNSIRAIIAIVSIAITFILTGCDPATVHVSVSPQIVCPGDQVTLTWTSTNGGISLNRSSGGGSSTEALTPASGSRVFTVEATTWFSLTVGTGWNRQATDRASVEVISSERSESIHGHPWCGEGLLRLGGSISPLLPTNLHSMVVNGVTILSPTDRDVTITYGGRVFRGRGGTDIFRGLSVNLGNFEITAPLLATEACAGTSGSTSNPNTPMPPPDISINVNIACPPRRPLSGGTGGLGQACGTNGACSSGLECQSGTCQPSGMAGDQTCAGVIAGTGAQIFEIGIRDPYGCAALIYVRANSRSEAEQCVSSLLLQGQTVVSPPASITYYDFVLVSPSGCNVMQYAGFTEEDALGCAQSGCPSCTSVTRGTRCN